MGLAFPVLASLGIAYLERGVGERKITRVGIPLRLMVRILVALLLLINLPWRQLPAQEAWKDRERQLELHSKVINRTNVKTSKHQNGAAIALPIVLTF